MNGLMNEEETFGDWLRQQECPKCYKKGGLRAVETEKKRVYCDCKICHRMVFIDFTMVKRVNKDKQ